MKHIEVHFTELEAKALLAGLKIALDSELDKSIQTAMKRGTAKLEYAEMRHGGEKWLRRHGLLEKEQDEIMQAVQLTILNHGESSMKIVLTDFARKAHFDPTKPGTTITDREHSVFEREVNIACQPEHASNGEVQWMAGYAPFCKLLCIKNWTDCRTGTLPITGDNARFLRSEYRARNDDELPVLVRWFEGLSDSLPVPRAEYLMLVLYSQEQLAKEETKIDADWGIVAILGQLTNEKEPMPPITAMRNALGVDEGGSGVLLDREAYRRSVEFWNTHATVKVSP